jgi:recombination protein RecA
MPPKKKTVKKSETAGAKKTVQKKDAASSYIESLKKQGMLGDIKKEIKFVPTGSWVMNRLIGDGTHTDAPGGFPRGYITEIFGDEGCGKTTLALHACHQAQLMGERVIYADFEHSLRTQFKYIENIGLDTSPSKFIHMTPRSLEEGVREIGSGLIQLKPAIIVVDSVTTMLPKASFDSTADDTIQVGLHAKLTGTFLNWISKRLEEHDTALILLNQLRSAIKKSKYDRGPDEVTSGGRAPRFFSSVRIELRVGQKQEVDEKSIITGASEKKKINQTVKAIVIKNKLDVPHKSGPLFIAFGQGIDNIMSIVTLAINKKVLKGTGWLEFTDPAGIHSFKVQGKMKAKKYLEENPEALEAMKPYLLPSEDTAEMIRIRDELESRGTDNLSDEELESLKRLRAMKLDKEEAIESPEDNPNLSLKGSDDLAELDKMMGSGGDEEEFSG